MTVISLDMQNICNAIKKKRSKIENKDDFKKTLFGLVDIKKRSFLIYGSIHMLQHGTDISLDAVIVVFLICDCFCPFFFLTEIVNGTSIS